MRAEVADLALEAEEAAESDAAAEVPPETPAAPRDDEGQAEEDAMQE